VINCRILPPDRSCASLAPNCARHPERRLLDFPGASNVTGHSGVPNGRTTRRQSKTTRGTPAPVPSRWPVSNAARITPAGERAGADPRVKRRAAAASRSRSTGAERGRQYSLAAAAWTRT